jgi:hypothetical protein
LSKLDEAMRKHVEYLVLKEERPFSLHDFLNFKVDGLRYHMSSGTFRNKVSALVKKGEVEVAYYSSIAFYTLNGVKFAKTMIPDHTGGYAVTIINNLFLSRITIHKKPSRL